MAQAETTIDVLIVGAGLSGIGAAAHLTMQCPNKSYAIVEQRADMGGTWDLFRYPGIRSDSDMHTLGYRFKPWLHEKTIADGPSIHEYVHETAQEYGISQHIHPQHWPKDLDYKGKKVTVIGSGATAVTIVPVMAEQGAQVTMLQRSPTYMVSRPAIDPFSKFVRKIMPEKLAYALTRWRNINMQRFTYWYARRNPAKLGEKLVNMAREALPASVDVDTHFVPKYGPWEQRLCLIPDSNMFTAITEGKAEVVTDHIDHFTKTGIQLKSGKHIESDIIITATGLNLVTMGKTAISVDGKAINFGEHFNYKGVMFNDIPNFASVFGYINASWTLKTDIVADYVCRLLWKMDDKNALVATPVLDDLNMPKLPFVTDFSSGYFARSFDSLPKNGDRHPWRVLQNYTAEKKILTQDPVDDGVMIFSAPAFAGAHREAEETLIAAE